MKLITYAFRGAFLVITCLGITACAPQQSTDNQIPIKVSTQKNAKPANVIVIVADQMRRASLGLWKQPEYQGLLNGESDYVFTPNLDEIAKGGAVFTDAVANYPLCSPFRGMLLSGMYPHNNGVTNNTRTDRPNVGLRTDITTLPEALKQAGYDTALVGKAHWKVNLPLFNKESVYVGTQDAPGGHFMRGTRYDTFVPEGPHRNGLDYWYQTVGHNHDSPTVYTNDEFISNKPDGHPFYPRVYSAVDQANVIIDYIQNSRGQRDSDKPFSVLWTMDPPHSPYQEMADTDEEIYNQYYKDVSWDELLNRPNVDLERGKEFARYHFSMVTIVDREIGRVVDELKKRNMDENTLIVFTADHGEMMASHGLMAKNTYYEESLSIPLVVSYPGKLNRQTSNLLISVPDYMPTILGLLDLQEYIPNNLDGTDFSDYIKAPEKNSEDLPISSLYYGKEGELGVRTHKYTFAINQQSELMALFNNQSDPYQLNSLSFDDIPEQDAIMLKQQLGYWLTRINHSWAKDKVDSDYIIYPH